MIPVIPLIVWMDLIGTIAFAVSGALVAARKNMDLFGVNSLAVITATGGGMIRDLVIGVIPPVMFRNPVYVFVSMITADVVFLFLYSEREIPMSAKKREHLLFWFDTLGLAAFTVDGVFAGTGAGYADRLFLISFLGVVTGVGGGALRDIFANQMPQIFVKHVYAMASVAGTGYGAFVSPGGRDACAGLFRCCCGHCVALCGHEPEMEFTAAQQGPRNRGAWDVRGERRQGFRLTEISLKTREDGLQLTNNRL